MVSTPSVEKELQHEEDRYSKLMSNLDAKNPSLQSEVGLEKHRERARRLMSNKVLPFKAQILAVVHDRTREGLRRIERIVKDLRLFAGRQIEVPATFIAGAADWGVFQSPGAFEAMQVRACAQFRGATLISDAGHWVQQEQPDATADALMAFLAR